MKTKSIILCLLLTLSTSLSFAQQGTGMNKQKGKQHMQQILSSLNLTAEQQEKIDEFQQARQMEFHPQKQEMKKIHEAFRLETQNYPLDEVKLRDLHDQIQTIQQKKAEHKLESILFFAKVLDKEQYQIFITKLHEMKGKRGKWKKQSY